MEILVLQPQDICYGVVDDFAREFGNELKKKGVTVYFFDVKTQSPQDIFTYMHKNLAAVVDFYSGMLSVHLADGENFWNHLKAPVFQVCYDFPVNIQDILPEDLENYHALCADAYYQNVFESMIPKLKQTFFFLPAGKEIENQIPWKEREIDIAFIGSYRDYRETLEILDGCENGIKELGYAYFYMMIEHVHRNQKEAFEQTLKQLNIVLSEAEFYAWMKEIGQISYAAISYERERVIEKLLSVGYQVHVYGESWKRSVYAKHPNLIMHKEVYGEEYLTELSKVKISINMTYCNKKNCTERVYNSMLNGAVVLSDNTSEYIVETFEDRKNILLFDLEKLEVLPETIDWILKHPDNAEEIVKAAYCKAKSSHTWKTRAEEFLQILENII